MGWTKNNTVEKSRNSHRVSSIGLQDTPHYPQTAHRLGYLARVERLASRNPSIFKAVSITDGEQTSAFKR